MERNADMFAYKIKNLNPVAKNDTPLPVFLQKIQRTIKFYYYERTKGRNLLGSNITFYQLIQHSKKMTKICDKII